MLCRVGFFGRAVFGGIKHPVARGGLPIGHRGFAAYQPADALKVIVKFVRFDFGVILFEEICANFVYGQTNFLPSDFIFRGIGEILRIFFFFFGENFFFF